MNITNLYRLGKRAHARRCGHTLAEVLVAVTVMSIMIIALMNYVQFAGLIWMKTHQAITLSSEASVLLDALERELSQSVSVNDPLPGDPTKTYVRFSKQVSDYGAGGSTDYGYAQFRIMFDNAQRKVITQIFSSPAIAGYPPSAADWVAPGSGGGDKKMDSDIYTYDLARHVKRFDITRIGNNLLEVDIQLEGTNSAAEATRTIELKRRILMPSF